MAIEKIPKLNFAEIDSAVKKEKAKRINTTVLLNSSVNNRKRLENAIKSEKKGEFELHDLIL